MELVSGKPWAEALVAGLDGTGRDAVLRLAAASSKWAEAALEEAKSRPVPEAASELGFSASGTADPAWRRGAAALFIAANRLGSAVRTLLQQSAPIPGAASPAAGDGALPEAAVAVVAAAMKAAARGTERPARPADEVELVRGAVTMLWVRASGGCEASKQAAIDLLAQVAMTGNAPLLAATVPASAPASYAADLFETCTREGRRAATAAALRSS